MKEALELIRKFIFRRPVPFVCGIILLVSIILMLLHRSTALETNARLETLETEMGDIRVNKERLTQLDVHMKRLQELDAEVKERLVRAENVARNSEIFYQWEDLYAVSVRGLKQGSPLDRRNRPSHLPRIRYFSMVPYTVTVEGAYVDILKLLFEIRSQPAIIRIDSLTLSKAGQEGGGDTVNAQIECYLLGEGENERGR